MFQGTLVQPCPLRLCMLLHGGVLLRMRVACLPAVKAEDGEEPAPPPGAGLDEATKAMQLEGLFLFAVVWSVGATCDAAGRAQFDHFFRCV